MAEHKKGGHDPRTAATRLAAVQAIYELDMMEADVDEVLASFAAERWRAADDDVTEELARPKLELLKELVRGVQSRLGDIDAALTPAMHKGRKLAELEAVLRAILRTATYELLARKTVPARAVISAYTGVADAFFEDDGKQMPLVAGVLNTVARALRAEEFQDAAS